MMIRGTLLHAVFLRDNAESVREVRDRRKESDKRLKHVQISASILSADVADLAAVAADLRQAGVDMLHFDVMDGQFVPNITFGMPVLAALDRHSDLFMDVHLMIEEPEKYAVQFVEAGADLVTFHVESRSDIAKTIHLIHEAGAKAGIVLKPDTPWETAIPYLDSVEVVLVMTVEPGFGGQKLIPECLDKVMVIRKMITDRGLATDLEVDGGIHLDNVALALEKGANVIVAGSAVFKDDIAANAKAFLAKMQ